MTDPNPPEGIRLQKVLAAAGVASRRAAEIMIEEGRVEVNGHVVVQLGTRVDPARDHIRVDGRRLPPERHHIYLALNKPRGVVSTMSDPEGRPTLADYVPRKAGRLFHVGRLDTDTEGLIVLTNDGDLAQRLSHPKFEVSKTYLAEVEGVVERSTVTRLAKGVTLEDGPVKPDKVKLVDVAGRRSLVQVTLHSGRNRVVRRLFDAVGHPVRRLARTRIGPIRLGDLPAGKTRELTRQELGDLWDAVEATQPS
ncbi:MAG: rRNA pseudouridine synthase [Propionibacteriaceae bacterium]|jgi:23S rRNA pseudouridine2605 synthase|nr:rRNA pseudouridine synthase [Propionibacteriaceae bacterium]